MSEDVRVAVELFEFFYQADADHQCVQVSEALELDQCRALWHGLLQEKVEMRVEVVQLVIGLVCSLYMLDSVRCKDQTWRESRRLLDPFFKASVV